MLLFASTGVPPMPKSGNIYSFSKNFNNLICIFSYKSEADSTANITAKLLPCTQQAKPKSI